MTGLAAARFVTASAVGAQRWTGPVLLFAVGLAGTLVTGGGVLALVAQGAVWLFPTSAWLVVATMTTEDESQEAVTAVVLAGVVRARALKLATAASVAAGLGGVSVAAAVAFAGGRVTGGQLALGLVADAACAAGGAALGLVCSRPLVRRPGWAATAVLLISVLELAVPHVPPVRAVVDALDSGRHGPRWPALLRAAAETALGTAALVTGGLALGRRRS